jgi:tetratricopeptide (TPR) repeat protein
MSIMKKFLIGLFFVLFIPSFVCAEVETITATHKYVMGDNDSKNDARRMCFMEAKRKVLEKAGSYIESSTTVQNYQLAKDEIIAHSAALLKIETIDEKWEIDGSNMAVTLTVKAEIDASILEQQLEKISKETAVKPKPTTLPIYFQYTEFQLGMSLKEFSNEIVKIRKEYGIETHNLNESSRTAGHLRFDYSSRDKKIQTEINAHFTYKGGIITSISVHKVYSYLEERSSSIRFLAYDSYEDSIKEGIIKLGEPSFRNDSGESNEAIWESEYVRYELSKQSSGKSLYLNEEIKYHQQNESSSGDVITEQLWKLIEIDSTRRFNQQNAEMEMVINPKAEQLEVINPKAEQLDVFEKVADKDTCTKYQIKKENDEIVLKPTIQNHHSIKEMENYYACRAEVYYKRNDFIKSIEDYGMAIYFNPANPRYFNKRGWNKHRIKEYDKAEHDYLCALSLIRIALSKENPILDDKRLTEELVESLYNIAKSGLSKRKYYMFEMSTTERYLDELLQIKPEFAYAYQMRADARLRQFMLLPKKTEKRDKACDDGREACKHGACDFLIWSIGRELCNDESFQQTVIDKTKGLEWQKGENTKMNWEEAKDYCESMELRNHSDWRLPTADELKSLWALKHEFPYLHNRSLYWASSETDDAFHGQPSNSRATSVMFMNPPRSGSDSKRNRSFVRCVRERVVEP